MKYRKLKPDEKVKKGDEVRIDGEWVASTNWKHGTPKGAQSFMCKYRRPVDGKGKDGEK